jgi:putative membrane protein
MDQAAVFALQRPSPALLKLYLVRSILAGPAFFLVFPPYLIRYLTLRYHFDDKGISMRWGFFFRREVNLTYARIQDIHLVSGLIQRWFGLANIMIQTASGNAAAEMCIEGLHEFADLRQFLYTRMRGYADLKSRDFSPLVAVPVADHPDSALDLLRDIRDELHAAREAIAARSSSPSSSSPSANA